MISFSLLIHFFPLKIGCCGLCRVDFIDRAGHHVLVNEQEVSILAYAHTASLVLYEHLLGHVDGQGLKCLLAGQTIPGPLHAPRY